MQDSYQVKSLSLGTTLCGGKYVIEKILGEGGFGITYYARHTMLDHCYAIKEFFISGKCVRDTIHHTISLQDITPQVFQQYRNRFVDEAKTLIDLNHPGVVKVVDIFEENGTSYIVMDFIEGETIQHMVERGGRLDYGLTVNYIAQLSDAVGYIHSKHVLHRDIKPDNVIVTPDNRVILIDFGSAREFVNDEFQKHTTILTKGYAPPEQYTSTSRKGNYSDIYSLGAVFYFCLTGVKPMDAATRTIEELPSPKSIFPGVPTDADRTIMKAMSLKPGLRHQSAAEFMDDLLNAKSNDPEPVIVPVAPAPAPAPVPEPAAVPSRDKTVAVSQPASQEQKKSGLLWLWILLGVLLVGGIVAAVLFLGKGDRPSAERKPVERVVETPVQTSPDTLGKADTMDTAESSDGIQQPAEEIVKEETKKTEPQEKPQQQPRNDAQPQRAPQTKKESEPAKINVVERNNTIAQSGTSNTVTGIRINGQDFYTGQCGVAAGEFACMVTCVGSVKDCKIECTGDWFSVNVDESGKMLVKYQENRVDKSRRGEVIISSGDVSAVLRLEQAGAVNRIDADQWFPRLKRLLNAPTTTFPGGGKYLGDLVDEACNGLGMYLWTTTPNMIYIGGWENHKKNGKGIYLMQKGYEFDGLKGCRIIVSNYLEDQADGYMSCYNRRGVLIYEGRVSAGKPSSAYPSSKTNSAKRFDYIDYGSSYYLGETLNGVRHGYGLYVDASGNPWIGNWANDSKLDGSSF